MLIKIFLSIGLLFSLLGEKVPTDLIGDLSSISKGLSASLSLDEEYLSAPTDDGGNPYNLLIFLTGVLLLCLHFITRRGTSLTSTEKAPPDLPQEHATISPDRTDPWIVRWEPPEPETFVQATPLKNPITNATSPEEAAANQEIADEISIGEIRKKAREAGSIDVGHLLFLLEATRSSYIHSRSLYLLGKYQVREALPMILIDMGHQHPWVRLAAAAALIRLKSNLIEERMIEMGEDPEPRVRATALLVLSRIGTERAHEILRKSIWDFEPEVRKNATLAIGRLKVPDSDFELYLAKTDFEESVRDKALWAYHQLSGA